MVQQGVSPVLHGPGSKLSMQARQECTSTKGMKMRTYGQIIKGHKTEISASTPVNTIHCYLCTACRRQQSFGRKVLNQTQARLMSILACSPVSTDQPSLSALPATITKGIKSNRGGAAPLPSQDYCLSQASSLSCNLQLTLHPSPALLPAQADCGPAVLQVVLTTADLVPLAARLATPT